MRQGIGPHRALRLSGNGDFRSFEPEPCRWQMVVGDPPFRSVVQFYKAIGIDENKLSHLAALERKPRRVANKNRLQSRQHNEGDHGKPGTRLVGQAAARILRMDT